MTQAAKPLVLSLAGDVQQIQPSQTLVDDANHEYVTTATTVRASVNLTVTALAASGQYLGAATDLVKGVFDVLKVVSALAFPVRLRIYASSTFRDADAARQRFNAPTPGSQHGVIMDLTLTPATGFTWVLSPSARGEVSDSSTNLYYTIDNLDIVPRNIDLTVTYFRGE